MICYKNYNKRLKSFDPELFNKYINIYLLE